MDSDEENSNSESLDFPDDILILLEKDYIRERDGLSLSLSGNNERFASVYGDNRRSLDIKGFYFLASLSKSSPWGRFYQKHIIPSQITSFDVSHCYWLPAEDLCHYIKQFVNLEELHIEDTQIRLEHLPQVFQVCKNLKKLSFTLSEKTLERYYEGAMGKEALDWMTQGFGRLTHLKIFALPLHGTWFVYEEFWLVTLFGVLRWCRDCVHLYIKIFDNAETLECRDKLQNLSDRTILIPDLEWITNLKTPIFVHSEHPSILERHFLGATLFKERQYHQLEKYWRTLFNGTARLYSGNNVAGSSTPTKFLVLSGNRYSYNPINVQLNDERFRHLEYVCGFHFSRLVYLPDLKFFRGYCDDDDEGLNDFCESHPMLEQLHVELEHCYRHVEHFGFGDWKLLSLKVLVYHLWRTKAQTGMVYMFKASPNIEELHLMYSAHYQISRCRKEMIEFYSSIRFNRLVVLSIDETHLFDGSYLPAIIDQCPKLERILLEGRTIESSLFLHLAECLPRASSLRDLRLKWGENEQVDEVHLERFFKALLKCSSHFERLVLIKEMDQDDGIYQHQMIMHSDFLLPFVTKMTHLVALCLVGFQGDPFEEKVLNQRLNAEIRLSDRPAFWFYVGPQLPEAEGNDSSVPRIHYSEVIKPIKAYDGPPRF